MASDRRWRSGAHALPIEGGCSKLKARYSRDAMTVTEVAPQGSIAPEANRTGCPPTVGFFYFQTPV
jgi:hypothetical protein